MPRADFASCAVASELLGPPWRQRGVEVNGMKIGRVNPGFGVIFVAMIVLAASCSPSSTLSPGVSDSARATCTAVGQRLGAPGGVAATARGSLTTGVVAKGQQSGDGRLDAAVRRLSIALDRGAAAAILSAESNVETSCVRLGIWQVYH